MGDPHELHHARRRRRLHHDPASRRPGSDRVRVSGIRGGPRTPTCSRSRSPISTGYKAVGTLVYAWPEALRQGAGRRPHPARSASADLGLEFDQILTEFVGANATHGRLRRPARSATRPRCSSGSACGRASAAPVERFTREIAPLVLTGPPSVTGFAGGRPAVEEIVAYWPALIDRREIEPHVRVEILGGLIAMPERPAARARTAPAPLPGPRPLAATRATPPTSASSRSSPA